MVIWFLYIFTHFFCFWLVGRLMLKRRRQNGIATRYFSLSLSSPQGHRGTAAQGFFFRKVIWLAFLLFSTITIRSIVINSVCCIIQYNSSKLIKSNCKNCNFIKWYKILDYFFFDLKKEMSPNSLVFMRYVISIEIAVLLNVYYAPSGYQYNGVNLKPYILYPKLD